eukprot:NODE_3123_length_407_cov_451.114525_g2499_i0.p2 GENE.NODE_3123_length_407_cov_451.114525_g2499_i0~~NODE_3123_length_407_cov_451.114525_g2499_i0.p2  ORF type:complete len:68 (-),score=17.44 NODE_3123_length_407_cov_451.114525_g2499_i0:133-336(-)
MADAGKLAELLANEGVQALKFLEPVSVDPTIAATHALKATGNDVAKALEWLEKNTNNPKIGDASATF